MGNIGALIIIIGNYLGAYIQTLSRQTLTLGLNMAQKPLSSDVVSSSGPKAVNLDYESSPRLTQTPPVTQSLEAPQHYLRRWEPKPKTSKP